MPKRRWAGRVGPFDDPARDAVGDAFGLFARALIAREEKKTPPFFGAHAKHVRAVTLGRGAPVLREWATAFEHDVGRVERLVKQRRDCTLESRSCAEVARAVPDQPTIVAINREPRANTDIDGE